MFKLINKWDYKLEGVMREFSWMLIMFSLADGYTVVFNLQKFI